MTTDVTEGVEGAVHVDQQHAFAVHYHPLHVAGGEVRNLTHRDKSSHLLSVPTKVVASLRLKRNSFAALSEVILRRSASEAPAKIRSRNSCDIGQVDSACGKSLPHSMVSTPMMSRRRIPQSSSMNSTNMLRCQ